MVIFRRISQSVKHLNVVILRHSFVVVEVLIKITRENAVTSKIASYFVLLGVVIN